MVEAGAALFGIAYVLLAIRQHRACWIAGGASTALYILVFLQAGLPLQAALQIFYVILSVYGWVQWRPGGAAPDRPASVLACERCRERGQSLGGLGEGSEVTDPAPAPAESLAHDAPRHEE